MAEINHVISRIQEMRGVVQVFSINEDCRDEIENIESSIKATLGIPVINRGVTECLAREQVICIIKKSSFRPPPEPTVLLISDDNVILGEEILPSVKEKFLASVAEEVVWLSDDFVLYPGRVGANKEYFVMPPVSFPEVEELDMKDVVSCSPSAPADMMLRKLHGFEDDPRLASILIGFNMS
ncbi:MAG: hypothetical protein GX369_05340 [Euryarchaeota archaeon]|nr:hypothetical protein [Euryarchaeota archaeon]